MVSFTQCWMIPDAMTKALVIEAYTLMPVLPAAQPA